MVDYNIRAAEAHAEERAAYWEQHMREHGSQCCECGEYFEPEEVLDNDMCIDCNMPPPEEMARMEADYQAHKHYGLLPSQAEELEQNLKDGGRK